MLSIGHCFRLPRGLHVLGVISGRIHRGVGHALVAVRHRHRDHGLTFLSQETNDAKRGDVPGVSMTLKMGSQPKIMGSLTRQIKLPVSVCFS